MPVRGMGSRGNAEKSFRCQKIVRQNTRVRCDPFATVSPAGYLQKSASLLITLKGIKTKRANRRRAQTQRRLFCFFRRYRLAKTGCMNGSLRQATGVLACTGGGTEVARARQVHFCFKYSSMIDGPELVPIRSAPAPTSARKAAKSRMPPDTLIRQAEPTAARMACTSSTVAPRFP
jgi:hypothetical protein